MSMKAPPEAELVEPGVVVALDLRGIDAGHRATVEAQGLGHACGAEQQAEDGEQASQPHGVKGRSRQFKTSPSALVRTARMWLLSSTHSSFHTRV